MEESSGKTMRCRQRIDPRSKITASSIPTSCLVLQMAIHFNILFSPIYYSVIVSLYYSQRERMNELEDFMSIMGLIISTITEIPRLLLGNLGNYSHTIPWILCFLLITSCIQFPVQLLMMKNPLIFQSPLIVAWPVMMIFLVVEMITSVFVVKWTVGIFIKQSKAE